MNIPREYCPNSRWNSQICYSYAEQRTARQILRLFNIIFMFGKLLKKIVGPKPKKVPPGKFYGIHFHGLTTHLAEIYRLISIRSVVPEQEEATFHHLKQIALNCSSRQPQNVINTCMLRIQFNSQSSSARSQSQQSLLSRRCKEVITTLFSNLKYQSSEVLWVIQTSQSFSINSSDAGEGIFRLIGSISSLLMPWLLKFPRHQQAWYWQRRIGNM